MNKSIQLIALNQMVSLLGAVLICVFCLAGCLDSTHTQSNIDSVASRSQLEFQRQRNRPPAARTLYAMADIMATQGKDSGCEFVLKRIIREHPQFFPAYNSLAELQLRQGRVNEAISTISKGLHIHPRDPVLLNNLGMCWLIRRNYEKALEMFTKASGIVPQNVRYRANMAVALGLMGRYDESLSLFKQVLPEDKANHNLNILREARQSETSASAIPSCEQQRLCVVSRNETDVALN